MKRHWPIVSLFSASCAGAMLGALALPAARAATTPRCDWRYLSDTNYPELPEGMDKKPMNDKWTAMSNAGYHLAPGPTQGIYLFERCQ